ncbi:GvpL/GvpF family gas vesicle protein [Streptomyces sp. NPDC002758]
MMSDFMTYVYAVARNADGLQERTAELRGVTGAPVCLVHDARDDQLTLVVSHVPALDFQEEALKQHLEDLDWLEVVARGHHGVIEALAARTTVLPLRLATVYLDDGRARDVLKAGRNIFTERLAMLAEHVEWGVKIYVEPAAVSSAPTPPATGQSPGRAYLRNRRQQQGVRDSVYRAAQTAAERIDAVGRRHATERVRHRVQQGVLAKEAGENVVNDAYLVSLERCDEFQADVKHAADGLQGVRIDVTGPWAPYSFAMPPGTSDAAAESEPP